MIKIDRELATTHLKYLGYKPGEAYLRFFYHSSDPRKDSDKGRKLSSLNWNEIERHQNDGRGVYVVVNGAGGGHTDADIKNCCAIFCEWDDIPLAEQFEKWSELGFVEPTFVVYSGDKSMQPYWVFDEPIAVQQWRELQILLIAAMKADSSNKNPSRVFRLAGGWHVKPDREPTKTEMVGESGIRYSYQDLYDRLSAMRTVTNSQLSTLNSSFEYPISNTQYPIPDELPDYKKITAPVPIAVPLTIALGKSLAYLNGVGNQRNTSMAALARDLIGVQSEFSRLGQLTDEDAYTLFIDACRRCSPGGGWGEAEWESIWQSALKSSPIASISHHITDGVENCIRGYYWRYLKADTQLQKNQGESVSTKNKIIESDDKLIQDYNKVVKTFGNRIRLNKLSKRIEVDGKPVSLDRAKLQLAIRHNILLKSGREDIQDIIAEVAEQNEYSPVAEYLLSLPKVIDTSILNTICKTYFGVEGEIYTTFIRKTLIAAVNRALKPGCKVDTALILQGKQGYRKSTFFKILAGDYFDDSMGAASEKDERLKLHRSWFIEWSELERIFGRKDASAAKAFVTSENDMVRPPYCRDIQEFPRPSIIVATTNQDEFLVDPTGARRFWVIPVQKKIDTVKLAEERDAIWAAAVAAYKSGELCYLNDDEELVAEAIAAEFRTSDPWEEPIGIFIENREWIRINDILDHLQIDLNRQDRSHQMRVASILKVMGWSKNIRTMGKKRVRVWVPDCCAPPQNNLDLPTNPELVRQVVHAENHDRPALQLQPEQVELPDLPKSKEKDFLEKEGKVETEKTLVESESILSVRENSLGETVDRVDPVVQNPSEQGIQKTPTLDLVVVPDEIEVDRTEKELVDFVRSAISAGDRATAKHFQDVLREVCDAGKADRMRVWGALSAIEQEAFKNLVKSPIEEIDAKKMREIALIWWEEQYPEQLQSLIIQMFGWRQPAQLYSLEIIKSWLEGESEIVRDRITQLIEIKNPDKI